MLLKLIAYPVFFLCLACLSAWVTIYLMVDSKDVEVPRLVGVDFGDGKEIIERLQLKIRKTGENYSQQYPRDKILSQNPAPGQRLKLHRTVKVIVSQGYQKITIPPLTGLSLREAKVLIEHKKLRLGEIARISSPDYPAGRVIAQDPDPRAPTIADSKVSLLVSSGPPNELYIMPGLVHKSYDEVVAFVKKRGLKLGNVRTKYYPGVASGMVIEQYPPEGFRMLATDAINIWVSRERSENYW